MRKEIENLNNKLVEKERDLETLKKQANQQASEYDRLADEYNHLERQGSSESKKTN
jgi:B-cell receptor-associated protein 31